MNADSPMFPLSLTPIFKTHIATCLLPIAYPRLYYYAHPSHLRTHSPEKPIHTTRTRHDFKMIISPLVVAKSCDTIQAEESFRVINTDQEEYPSIHW